MRTDSDTIPPRILEAYGLELQAARRATSGLIHQTWIIETQSAERYVLQQLHRMIPPEVNERIRVVTEHLRELGQCTPLLVPTVQGEHFVQIGDDSWRVLTYVPGTSFDTMPDFAHACEAGRLLARFHAAGVNWGALETLPVSTTHNLARHLELLRAALKSESQHGDHRQIAMLAEEIFGLVKTLPATTANPPRLVHGDPKLSNILFGDNGAAICLVDLDTVGLMDLVWELGDAFRSWCNPAGEDTENAAFSLDIFEHAISGYAELGHRFINPQELAGIVPGTITIYIELAARFCADALLERYFAWDSARFPSRTAHNFIRAQGQLNAAKDLIAKRLAADRIVGRVFGTVRN